MEKEQTDSVVSFGPYRFDPEKAQLWRGVREVRLTGKAFSVLRYFAEHPGQLVSKDALFEAVWPQTVVTESTLASCIQELRQALRDDAKKPRYIETVHRRGYRFIAPLNTPPPHGSRAEVRGPSQEDGGSIPPAGGGRPEKEGRRQEPSTNGQPVGSVFSTLQLPLGQAPAEIQESDADPAEPTPWIPVSASMTPPSTASQPPPLSSPSLQVLDPSTLAVRRPWAVWHRVVLGLILLVGGILTVRYLARPLLSPPDSELGLQQAPPTLALPDKPSIAVLPFTNISADPTQEYFSDGLTSDLITDLSRISGLFVIARNSSFTYKGKPTKVQEIGRELGVRYVLEGSVQKREERVRINAQLVDVATGYQVWSERYDRPLSDIFTVQDEIVQQLVTTLQVEVKEAELARVQRIPTNNLSAYDAVLRAEEPFQRISKEGIAQARPLYEQAIALDPQYAVAYAFLGWTYWEESHWDPDPQKLERAFTLAQQAIALDESLPAAHSLVSLVHQRRQQPEQAIAEGRWAISLDTNNAYSYFWLAEVLNYEGQPAEAIDLLKKAMRLDPHYPFWFPGHLGIAYFLSGRYAEAITAQQQSILRQPNAFFYADLAGSYLLQWGTQLDETPGNLARALEAARQAVTLNESLSQAHLLLGYVYAFQRHYEQAVAEMERAVTLDPFGATSTTGLAAVLSWAGRAEEALRAAEQVQYRRFVVRDFHLSNLGAAYALIGHYEEAQTALQRFLALYPAHLNAHLSLAAVYSQLGKEAEARAEAAEVLRLNPNFSLAVYKERAPIKDPAMLERQIAALRKAGLK